MSQNYFQPISKLIPNWPSNLLAPSNGDLSFLDEVGLTDFALQYGYKSIGVKGTFMLSQTLSFDLPFIDGVSVALNESGNSTSFNFEVELGTSDYEVRLKNTSLSLIFSSDLLTPMVKQSDGSFAPDPKNKNVSVQLTADIGVRNTDGLFIEGAPSLSFSPFMIGSSGVVIEASDIMIILTPQDLLNLPQGVTAPANFQGVYIGTAVVHLPSSISVDLPNELELEQAFLGTGGISGTVSGTWIPKLSGDGQSFTGDGSGTLFGIPFALLSVSITFQQNALTGCDIQGAIIVPYFNQPVLVDLGFTTGGDFTVALSALSNYQTALPGVTPPQTNNGLLTFVQPGLLSLAVNSLSFQEQDGDFVISIGGSITPLILSGDGITWPTFDVKALSIDSQGHVKISGGWLNLPNQKGFNFYAFIASLTQIGFGNNSDGSRWFGVSGGVKLVDGIPLSGNVNGLKIIWGGGSGPRIQVDGIGVSFTIQGVLQASGNINFFNDSTGKGFKGGVNVSILPINTTLDLQMMIGKNEQSPPFTFLYIYADVELPAGIPLFTTGASLYGFAGLFGYNVAPNKGLPPADPNESWYQNPDGSHGWYMRSPKGVTDSGKWTDQYNNMAFGLGVTLGTTADNGYTFSGKVLLVLLIPGPTIIVEGLANFLKDRKTLETTDPIFRVLAVFDGKAGTFLLNVQAKYKIPDNGKTLDITALAEVFFNFNDPSAWHLYIGKDEQLNPFLPLQNTANMIRAKILSLFEADAFFMIDNNGFAVGGQIVFNKNFDFSVIKVQLYACIAGYFELSFKPPEAKGELDLQGRVSVSAFGFTIGLAIDAQLAIATPKPFSIDAKFDVKLTLPWPLPSPSANVELSWQDPPAPPPYPVPVGSFGALHPKVTENWPLIAYPTYDPNNDGLSIDGSSTQESEPDTMDQSPVVPLDAQPVINFNKAVHDNSAAGFANAAPIPASGQTDPASETAGAYTFTYSLEEVVLEKMSKTASGSWQSVDLNGSWQVAPGSTQPKNTCLLLSTNTAFNLTNAWTKGSTSQYGNYNPCNINTTPAETCVDFEKYKVGNPLPNIFVDDPVIIMDQSKPTIVSYGATWIPKKQALLLTSTVDAGNRFQIYLKTLNKTQSNTSVVSSHAKPPVLLIPELQNTGYGKILSGIQASLQNSVVAKTTATTVLAGTFASTIALLVFPEDVSEADIYFGKGTSATVYILQDDMKSIVSSQDVVIPESTPDAQMGATKLTGSSFRIIAISGVALISEVCYIPTTEMEQVNYNTEQMQSMQETIQETWSHSDTILEPGMYYRITAKCTVNRNSDSMSFTQYGYFQTQNPPGVFPANSSSSDAYPTGGPLKDLSSYIETTIPSAGQKPVFRSYDIGVIFNESYVEQMYLSDNLTISIELLDNNSQPVVDANGNVLELENVWGNNPTVSLTQSEGQYIETINESTCVSLDYAQASKNQNLLASSDDLVLLPGTFYTANLVAMDGQNNTYKLFSFSFTTSEFATFLHLIQSFQDGAWDQFQLTQTESIINSNDKMSLEGLLQSSSPGNAYNSSVENVMFEQINTLFGLGVRQLPSNLEILCLDDKSRSYGFLLESPEPLDWIRTTIGVSLNKKAPNVEEASETVKIVGGSIDSSGSGTDYDSEYIDILVRNSLDVSAMIIQHKSDGQASFANYYSFPDQGAIQAGTVIRLHTGSQASDSNPSQEVENVYLGLSAWQLSSAGETIQLLDRNGKILHTRHIEPSSSFATQQAILVRNADGTRAFVFIPQGGELAASLLQGKYSFDFVYNRNIGPADVDLKRHGSDEPEESVIEFSLPAIFPGTDR